jgi:mannose-6-phosphate isomerase-like protein (cupin superfamily)
MEHWQGTAFEGLSRLPGPAQERFVELFRKDRVSIEIYAPRGTDPQQPHDQDEIYVVISGTGSFVAGDSRRPFGPGDAIFVAAGIVHRFEDFTDDLVVWVVFV